MLHMAKHSAAKSADKQKILDAEQENAEAEAAAKALAAEELDESLFELQKAANEARSLKDQMVREMEMERSKAEASKDGDAGGDAGKAAQSALDEMAARMAEADRMFAAKMKLIDEQQATKDAIG